MNTDLLAIPLISGFGLAIFGAFLLGPFWAMDKYPPDWYGNAICYGLVPLSWVLMALGFPLFAIAAWQA